MTVTGQQLPLARSLFERIAGVAREANEPVTTVALLSSEVADHEEQWADLLDVLGHPALGKRRDSVGEFHRGERQIILAPGTEVTISEELHRQIEGGAMVARALRASSVTARHVVIASILDDRSALWHAFGLDDETAERALATIAAMDVAWIEQHVAASSTVDREPLVSAGDNKDDDSLVRAVDKVLRRGTPLYFNIAFVVMVAAVLALVACGVAVVEFDWRPGLFRDLLDPPGAWIREGTSLSASGDHVAAAEAYRKALQLSPHRLAAIEGRTCELWALGYRDSALIDAQLSMNAPDWMPRSNAAWPRDCILQPDRVRALRTIRDASGVLIIVPSANPAAGAMFTQLSRSPPTRTGWRDELIAGCLNTLAGYDWLAARQLNVGLSDPSSTSTTGALHDCIVTTLPSRYVLVAGQGGRQVVEPRDLESSRYTDRRSPVPPPTTLPVPDLP